jgi:Transposase DDE domain group 1
VLQDALLQLPDEAWEMPMLVRADSGGATHEFLNGVRELKIRFSVGFDLTEPVRQAVLAMPEDAWVAAITQAGEVREGAAVCELKGLDLSGWPEGTRAICRRERPHPGAQLTFTDYQGFRFQVFITDQPDSDLAQLEARHRAHARVEDRIRCAKDCGLRNLPFRDFAPNQVWLELILAAQDLLAFFQLLCLDGQAQQWEPKTLRYCLLHTAARLVRTGRRAILRLQRNWPWTPQLFAAFQRLRSLPTA